MTVLKHVTDILTTYRGYVSHINDIILMSRACERHGHQAIVAGRG